VGDLRVGLATDEEALTGCTVLLAPDGMVAGYDVRGGGVGERELATLHPDHLVDHIHALVLTGGSAMGLEAAAGVVQWCREQGIGFPTGITRIPIVPAAVIFDLSVGLERWPDAALGYQAAIAARPAGLAEGNAGAGAGASAGKLLGIRWATKTGQGAWTEDFLNEEGQCVRVAALVVANPFGDLRDPQTNRLIAGTRSPEAPGQLLDTAAAMLQGRIRRSFGETSTVLAVVATDARLDRQGCRRVARMASAGLARVLSPAFTSFDGDVVFVVSSGELRADAHAVGVAAAAALERALVRAATEARAAAGLPAAAELAGSSPG
jgi:L-aminopeptidase/D-esterase-like protein